MQTGQALHAILETMLCFLNAGTKIAQNKTLLKKKKLICGLHGSVCSVARSKGWKKVLCFVQGPSLREKVHMV